MNKFKQLLSKKPSQAFLATCMVITVTAVIFTWSNDTPGTQATPSVITTEQAEQIFRATHPSTTLERVQRAPIPGLFQIHLSNFQVVYFSPETKLTIFGRIMNEAGQDITSFAAFDSILPHAIKVGSGKTEIIEITDPGCSWCLRSHEWFKDKDVTRYLLFLGNFAADKAEHILCSDDPAAAYHAIYNSQTPETLLTCSEGKQAMATHREIANSFGANGTPTFIINNDIIRGFDQARIQKHLQ